MHCHLIVSRKDQTNKKKLSPHTNHKNTKKVTVTGGFDRVNLFKQAEQSFDKLFDYDRQQSESFDYRNTMKNGSISEQLDLQEQNFTGEKKNSPNTHKYENVKAQTNINTKALLDIQTQKQTSENGLGSQLSILPSVADISPSDETQPKAVKKKKWRIRR